MKYKLELLRKPFVSMDDDKWDAMDLAEFRGHIYIDQDGSVAACRPDGQWIYWLMGRNRPYIEVPPEFGFERDSQGRITGNDLEELKAFVEKHRKESE